jgi:hypothetical protein
MANPQKLLYAPKHCKGRKPGCRRRKKKHQSFLKSEKDKLKMAVADKLKIVKVVWIKHYACFTFVGSKDDKIYCNYNYLCYMLRCRLFYESSPFCIINLYFYNKMEHTEEGDFMTGYPNLKEKLVGRDQKEIEARSAYLGSDTAFQDARKLCK